MSAQPIEPHPAAPVPPAGLPASIRAALKARGDEDGLEAFTDEYRAALAAAGADDVFNLGELHAVLERWHRYVRLPAPTGDMVEIAERAASGHDLLGLIGNLSGAELVDALRRAG
ncbi:hypothetical protein GCM10022221_67880 [Actinocorallia aurea]